MSSPHYWTEYQRLERRWDKAAFWIKTVSLGAFLLAVVWVYAVLLFSV